MGFIQKPTPGAPVIGLFAPCDPRIDQPSRERAANIVTMTAKVLKAISLPLGARLGIYVADQTVERESDADAVALEFQKAGVGGICIVPDTWFYPGKTAIALTSHFPRGTPLACIAGNNAPKPGVVGVDAVVGAYSQTGILCQTVIGNMPETGQNPEFDAKTKGEIIDVCWAMAAAVWLRGKRVLCADTDSMQMETALNHVHAARRSFGLESTRESMKLFADMIHAGKGYDKDELKELYHWVTEVQWKDRIHQDVEGICSKRLDVYSNPGKHKPAKLTKANEEKLREELKLYLILRDYMARLNAVGGGWTSQLAWGSDHEGTPMACADIAEALFNSTFDHRGPKAAIPFATENDYQALVTQVLMAALTGGQPCLFADYRKVYEPWEIQKKADELGIALDPEALYMKLGTIDMDNSGSGSLDWAGPDGSHLFEVYKHYFPGGGFSTGYISPGGIDCFAGRLAYSDLTGQFTMICGEAQSVALPAPIAEAFCHASSYSWPHTWITFKHVPASITKYGCPANHMHMVQKLPMRRWQYFSDYANVLNHRWELMPSFIEGVDRMEPMLYRIAGGERHVKLKLGGR
jgi:L-fucose/D-arabinose isomerase